MIWIGRSAGDSRWRTIGPSAGRGVDRGAEQVLHPDRRGRFVALSSRSAPIDRSAVRVGSAPAGRGRRRPARAAATAAPWPDRRARGLRGPWPPAGTAPATRRACPTRVSTLQSGHGSPTRSMEEVDALAEIDRGLRPSEYGQSGAAQPGASAPPWSPVAGCGPPSSSSRAASTRVGVRRVRPARRGASSHSSVDPLVDLVGERHRHVVGVERRGQADPGPISLAVEVGGDDERLLGEGVGRRAARRPTRFGAGTGRGGGGRRGDRGTRAAERRRRGRRRSGRCRSVIRSRRARSRGAVAQPAHRTPIGAGRVRPRPASTRRRIERSAGSSSGRPRSRSRSSISTASAQPEWGGLGDQHPRQPGMNGRARASGGPTSVTCPSASMAPSSRQQLRRQPASPDEVVV